MRVDRARSYSDIEGLGRRIRQVLGVKSDGAFPALAVFETLSDAQFGIPLTYAVANLDEGVEAKTEYIRRLGGVQVALSETVYEKLEEDDPRARFTFTHELVHVVAHQRELVRLSHIPHTEGLLRAVPSHKPYEDSEWQADAGAAAVLMPATALARLEEQGPLTISTIMRIFGVSYEAAKNRLDHYSKRKAQLLGAH